MMISVALVDDILIIFQTKSSKEPPSFLVCLPHYHIHIGNILKILILFIQQIMRRVI